MERLLIKAKAGDNYTIQLLLNKYKNLLNSASRQHHLISIQEEAYEEAVISFYQAIKDFDYCEPHTCDFNHELGKQNSQRI